MARKILLADDSVTAQNMGRKILADAGYEVITVNNGSAALKKIAELKPDVIILDVYMPGYSGLEVCQRLKDAQETSRVPVLLTVGKLEPFKPEEAKRVRADGFIVKPFEASELLSSLSKLEDKIVPRAEASKPGRFARVTASLEENRFDRTVAIDEDKGWKDRISFPPKKKEKAASDDEDGATIASGRDRKPAEKSQPVKTGKTEETRIDLGALAPEGLPKDVTPEEIAALAAAAAQVKGKILETSSAQSAAVEAKSEREFQPQELTPTPITTVYEEKSDAKTEEKREEKKEDKLEAETRPVEVKLEQQEEKSPSDAVEPPMPRAASAADVIAAIAGLNQDAAASTGATLGDEISARQGDSAENQPVTMALTGTNAGATNAGATNSATDGRWQAVALALAPEDAAVSLENEMQKAHAAFAGANNLSAVEGSSISASAIPASAIPAISTENYAATESYTAAEVSVSETRGTISATGSPDTVQPLSALANGSSEAIRATVQELEMVAEPYEASPTHALPTHAESAPSSVSATGVTNQTGQTSVESPEAGASEIPLTAITPPTSTANLDSTRPDESVAEVQQQKTEDWKQENPASNEAKTQDRAYEGRKSEDVRSEDGQYQDDDRRNNGRRNDGHPNEDHANEDRFVAAVAATPLEKMEEKQEQETPEPPQEVAAAPLLSPVPDELAPISQAPSAVTAFAGELAIAEVAGDTRGGTTKKESDETADTAAAWASWRRVRESDSPNSNSQARVHEQDASAPQDAAAMAVAAGAEKTPDEPSAQSESSDIANIVDSVLADLRPKIFEEISRKMGQKK